MLVLRCCSGRKCEAQGRNATNDTNMPNQERNQTWVTMEVSMLHLLPSVLAFAWNILVFSHSCGCRFRWSALGNFGDPLFLKPPRNDSLQMISMFFSMFIHFYPFSSIFSHIHTYFIHFYPFLSIFSPFSSIFPYFLPYLNLDISRMPSPIFRRNAANRARKSRPWPRAPSGSRSPSRCRPPPPDQWTRKPWFFVGIFCGKFMTINLWGICTSTPSREFRHVD